MFDSSTLKKEMALAEAEPALMDDCVPSWQPIVAKDARPIGFRLALRGPTESLAPVLDAVLSEFATEGGTSFPHGLVILAPLHAVADDSLLHWSAPRNVLLEIGAAVLSDAATLQRLLEAQGNGVRLALRADGAPVTREQAAPFQYIIAAQRASKSRVFGADPAWLATGLCTRAAVNEAFKNGANAVIGWPLDEPVAAAKVGLQAAQQAVLELIRLVQADAEVTELERGFQREPMLAYLLLTLANSPAFVRGKPIASLQQAITLLGYQRLTKWLVLLLVVASKESRRLPQIQCAIVRGFFMENLAAAAGSGNPMRDAAFVVGAFSLLDKITGEPLPKLVGELALPDEVVAALLSDQGPFAPPLRIAAALEHDRVDAANEQAAGLHLSPTAVRVALLQALAATDALQSIV